MLVQQGVQQCVPHYHNPEKFHTALTDSKVREALEAISQRYFRINISDG